MKKKIGLFLVLLGMGIVVTVTYRAANFRNAAQNLQHTNATPISDQTDLKAFSPVNSRRLSVFPQKAFPGRRSQELAFVKSLPRRETAESAADDILPPDWTSRGPYNVGGRTRALALDVTNENIILAGGVTGGLWRSADAGATWKKVTKPEQIQIVTCIAQDKRPGKTNIWYYGTGERYGTPLPGMSGDGVFKSVDGGQTWQQLSATAANMPQDRRIGFNYCWNIAVDPFTTQEDKVYVATDGIVYRSSDGGDTWDKVFDGSVPPGQSFSLDGVPTDVAVTSTGAVYATIGKPSTGNTQVQGIWRSHDGKTWTKITPAGWPSQFFRTVIAITPSNENVVYFLASTPGFDDYRLWKYTYLSGDGAGAGGNWQDLSANLTSNFIGQFSFDMTIAIKPNDPNVIYAGGIVLARSTDGFATAANTKVIVPDDDGSPGRKGLHVDQHALVFSRANPEILYSANDGGVYRTTHELAGQNQWTSLNNGYVTTQFYCVAIDRATPGSEILLGGTQDNGTWFTTTASETAPWREILPGDGANCAVADGGAYYYLWSSYKPGDGIWQAIADASGNIASITSINARQQAVSSALFLLDPLNTNIMYASGIKRGAPRGLRFILRNGKLNQAHSEDNWTILENSKVEGEITALGISTASPSHRLYYSTGPFFQPANIRLFRLDNADSGDETPVEITGAEFSAAPDIFNAINSIAVDPNDGNKLLIAISGYDIKSLFYSENGGATWINVSGNLEEKPDGAGNGPSIRAAAILPLGEGKILYLAGGSTGLYSTTKLEGMATVWRQEGSNTIGYTPVEDIEVRVSDRLVAIATHGHGVFSANIDPRVAVVDEQNSAPRTFALRQNYPNPFNAMTAIRFELPEPGFVSIKVYDVQGREMATIVSDNYPTGIFEAKWNAQGLASGSYFYRMQTNAFTEVKKLILLK